jgi:hypothetical protein
MTDPVVAFSPTDMRRAAALLTHYQAGNPAGLLAIMLEADEADGSPDLAAAVCALFFQLSPELMTEEGGAALRELVRSYAAAEAGQ